MARTDETSSGRGSAGSGAPRPDRRQFLRLAGGAAVVGPLAGALAGCGSGSGDASSQRPVRIGYVSPQTGSLSSFGAADSFVIDQMRAHFREGIPLAGVNWPLDIIVRDSQSDTAQAATVATELILQDQVDLVLVASTPETVNPVSDQCEAYGVPCISSVAPWQSWYYGRRNTTPQVADAHPFTWTYHFFWGLDDLEKVYADIWSRVETNKKIGALFPKDSDGNAFADAHVGFPASTKAAGYDLSAPIQFADLTADYTSQIRQFSQASADIIIGVPQPPDFISFWTQLQRGTYRPKVVTVAKALLFPQTLVSLGDAGENLCSEVWWSPRHPYQSSLTGEKAQRLADDYEATTRQQWTQPIGFVHALFEVAAAAFARVGTPADRQGLVTAIRSLSQQTVVGTVDFSKAHPNRNVAPTPLVGGQWRRSKTALTGFDLVIVTDTQASDISVGDPHVRAIGSTA